MKESLCKRVVSVAIALSLVVTSFTYVSLPVKANEVSVKGIQYAYGDNSKYVEAEALGQADISGKTQFGEIKLEGNLSSTTEKNGFPAYDVSSGVVSIKYNISVDSSLNVVDDKVKNVSDATLDSNILSGTIIVLTSQDGEKWLVDKAYTDVLDENSGFNSLIYESNYVQQANGCYFRVIVAYKTEKLLEESTFLWFIDTSDYEYTRWAEVYKFYIADKEKGVASSVNTTPRTVFQDSKYRTKTEEDKGYTGKEEETIDDPHYGWNLGDFTINGYTAKDTNGDNTPVFLKNVGDQVTLWFTLNQDINKLNGNSNLFINEDTKGWDEYFGIQQTNFKKGTLIIRQTDAEGADKDPVIFINYLEANTRTGADTKVKLFEEGDYEVALDYEIKDTGPIPDSVTDYRVYFKFKIRNSNCNIYLFDTVTQNELADRANTENGFRLDYANSKYLDVYVEYKAINFNGTSYSEDTRGNKSAKNGSQYVDEGIYIISVQHDYNNSRTTDKTIYVGSSPIIRALSLNNITIADVNNLLAQGYTIGDDGTLITKTAQEQDAKEAGATEENSDEAIVEEPTEATTTASTNTTATTNATVEETPEPIVKEEASTDTPSSKIPIIAVILVVIAGASAFIIKGRKKITPNFEDPESDKQESEDKEEE
ncbi:hypothetical protein [Butyrivibrio fibrisolvens]|uniref:hypothetical protein n=1 Tax=Butyrivibrio fibrisolvens TaxID=831 RepID=UPI0003B548D3|nr:hypothetical protein [Butyrivibrio fibrisolvens]